MPERGDLRMERREDSSSTVATTPARGALPHVTPAPVAPRPAAPPPPTPRPSAPPLPANPVDAKPLIASDPRYDKGQLLPPPHPERRKKPRSARAHLFVTVCHWAMVILLTLNLLTGMRMGWAYLNSPFGGPAGAWGRMLSWLSPRGTLFGVNLITLHVFMAFGLFLVIGVYLGYMVRSRAVRRIKLTRGDVRKLVVGIAKGRFLKNKGALWSANLLVYWISFLFIAVLGITGVAIYRVDLGLFTVLGGYDVARLLHALVAYLLIPYTILHGVLQWLFGRFWTIFKAEMWRPHVRAGSVAVALAVPVVIGLYALDEWPTTLTVPRIPQGVSAPVLDGDPSDPVWTGVQAVALRTVSGINDHGPVDVTIKAVHDGSYVYFQFQWTDPDVSFKRWPLIKTENGWKMLQSAYERADENVYYEDKLSVYVTNVRNGSCASTCHLGVGPYAAKGAKHGLHYTAGEVGDLWQWKSVRSDPMGALTGEPGYMDDMHFRGPDPVPADPTKARYTAGYYADPDNGAGYAMNFTTVDPSKPVDDTYVIPKVLPLDKRVIQSSADATTLESPIFWIHKSQSIPYTKEADTYPVGTVIPDIIVEPFTGDRADIRAKGAWHQGRWTLEARRVLDTKSKYDVPFVLGEPVYITVATYNRSETRHSEHIKPIRVILQP